MSESTRDQRMTVAPVAFVDLTVPRATEAGKSAWRGGGAKRQQQAVSDDSDSDVEFVPSSLAPSKRSKARAAKAVSEASPATSEPSAASAAAAAAAAPAQAGASTSSSSSSSSSASASASASAAVTTVSDLVVAPVENRKRSAPKASAAGSGASAAAYVKARAADVRKRSFPLSAIATGVVPCARTVKAIAQWAGLWPAVREFLQNTVDHLELLVHGRLNPVLTLDRSDDPDTGAATLHFRLAHDGKDVCTIHVPSNDELIIEQAWTYPLHPRALDTGVNDTTKSCKGSKSAGGFGDGFKTAMVALIALPGSACEELTWLFRSEGRRIGWSFRGAEREAVGAFSKATVMEVAITNQPETAAAAAASEVGSGGAISKSADNVMVQTYRVRGIGSAFLSEAVPKLQVFWTDSLVRAEEAGVEVLSTRHGDMLCLSPSLPVLECAAPLGSGGASGRGGGSGGWSLSGAVQAVGALVGVGSLRLAKRPEPGVYVKGIWVRKPPIPECVMSFSSGKLNVSGRDRNDVDADELLEATLRLLMKCDELATLRGLLEPLRRPSLPPTWLTKPGASRFVNQLLGCDPEFFRHTVLGLPQGCLFVSKRTTDSKQPFIKWASAYLAAKGAPLVPLEPKSNRHLFTEASEEELEARCVQELLKGVSKNGGGPQAESLRKAIDSLLSHLRLRGKMKVHLSEEVAVPFTHADYAFVPVQPLTRGLIIKLLGVLQRKLGGYDENFTHVQQALFEAVPGPADRPITDLAEIEKVVERAKQVKAEASTFFAAKDPAAAEKTGPGPGDPAGGAGGKGKQRAPEAVNVVDDDEVHLVEPEETRGVGIGRGGNSRGGGSGGSGMGRSRAALEQQISKVRTASDGGGEGLGGGGFAADGADDAKECIKPSSALESVAVCEGAGGGIMLADKGSHGLLSGGMPGPRQAQLLAAREALDAAKTLLVKAVPSTKRLVDSCVRAGWDGQNNEYAGFCVGSSIVVNLAPMVKSTAQGRSLPKDAVHELTLTLCHELAHLLECGSGHGPKWRSTQDALVQAVLLHVGGESLGGGSGGAGAFAGIGGCRCCSLLQVRRLHPKPCGEGSLGMKRSGGGGRGGGGIGGGGGGGGFGGGGGEGSGLSPLRRRRSGRQRPGDAYDDFDESSSDTSSSASLDLSPSILQTKKRPRPSQVMSHSYGPLAAGTRRAGGKTPVSVHAAALNAVAAAKATEPPPEEEEEEEERRDSQRSKETMRSCLILGLTPCRHPSLRPVMAQSAQRRARRRKSGRIG